MHVRFAEIDDGFIKSQVQNGFYTNETEVVRDAVRRLREEKQARNKRFYEAVMKGDAAIERGDVVPYSRDLMEEIQSEADRGAQNGETANNPDAIPENFKP